jgi:hypothetical protein
VPPSQDQVLRWTSFAETFREQAKKNHDQTLERLVKRGGLAPEEMWCAAHQQGLFEHRQTIPQPSEQECGEWLNAELARIGDRPSRR